MTSPRSACRLLLFSLLMSCVAHAQEPHPSGEADPDAGDSIQIIDDDHVFTGTAGHALQYRLDPPRDFVDTGRYPLVLCLHGAGGSTQAGRVLSQRQPEPCFVLVPSVRPRAFSWAGRRIQALPTVLELIDVLVERLPIDPDRIYVTGQSMGGQGTWGAIAARPGFFAAAVPVCGGWDPEDAERISGVPVWVFHGASDNVVPVRRSRDMVTALRAAGGNPKYTEYPGVEHNSWTRTYQTEALWSWLFEQRRGRPDDDARGRDMKHSTGPASKVEDEPH